MNFLQRIASVIFTLFGVATVVFFLFNVLPGDPAQMMLGQNESSEELSIIRKKFGFDQPVFFQYAHYINDLSPVSIHSLNDEFTGLYSNNYNYLHLLTLNNKAFVLKWPYLRESYHKSGVEVSDIIRDTLPNTRLSVEWTFYKRLVNGYLWVVICIEHTCHINIVFFGSIYQVFSR